MDKPDFPYVRAQIKPMNPFTWYSDYQRAQREQETVIGKTFYDARNRSTSAVIKAIDDNDLKIWDYTDNHQNTLLHIAVLTCNYTLIDGLLHRATDIDIKNIYGDSSLDLAIKNYDKRAIRAMLYYNPENDQLKSRVKELDAERKRMTDELTTLRTEVTSLKKRKIDTENSPGVKKLRADITQLTTENRRLVTVNTKLTTENRRIVTINTKLTTDNEKLTTNNTELTKSVNAMRASFKK